MEIIIRFEDSERVKHEAWSEEAHWMCGYVITACGLECVDDKDMSHAPTEAEIESFKANCKKIMER